MDAIGVPEGLARIEADLLAPGGMFALEDVTVLGEPMQAMANRLTSLRDALAASVHHGDAEYLVKLTIESKDEVYARRAFDRLVALLAGTMVLDWLKVIPAKTPPAESALPSASPSQETMQMGLAHIPTSNSCLLCHEKGGAAELKPIPALGHPLEGWTTCLT